MINLTDLEAADNSEKPVVRFLQGEYCCWRRRAEAKWRERSANRVPRTIYI